MVRIYDDKKGDDNIKELGEAIKVFLETYNLNNKYSNANIGATWHKVVGEYVSRKTKKVYYSKGCLYLQFDSAALRNEMIYSKSTIIKRMNEEIGSDYIKDINFS